MYLLWSSKFFSFANHIRQPICTPIQIQNEAERSIRDFFDTVARHVAYCDAEFAGSFNVYVVNAGTDSHYDSQGFELFEVFLCQDDCVPH